MHARMASWEVVLRMRAVFAINGTSPPQSSNQLSCTGDTLEHLRKAHLGFECRFRFLLCKKSGILLISEPLLNSDAKAGDLPLTKVSPGVSLTQRLTGAHAAQGGVTLGPEQGELGANFCHLGFRRHGGPVSRLRYLEHEIPLLNNNPFHTVYSVKHDRRQILKSFNQPPCVGFLR
jgi:hypothetical protein